MKIELVMIFFSILLLFGLGVRAQLETDIQNIYKSNQQIMTQQQIQINALKRSIGYLETEITTEYSYLCPIHKDDYRRMTSPFGMRNIPSGIYTGGSPTRDHLGVDFVGTRRARVIAIADGEVVDRWYVPDGNRRIGHPIMGGMIVIKHSDHIESVYAHLSVIYINETNKRFVKAGQVIGRTGETGLTDGEHLHFEIRKNGISVQPLKYIDINK